LSARERPVAAVETMAAVSRCIARFLVAKNTRLIEVFNLSANGVGSEVFRVIVTDTRHSQFCSQRFACVLSLASA
jgi:hypothetical protein